MDLGNGPRDGRTEWSWPPYAPAPEEDGRRYQTEEWAPRSVVRRPWVRVGRWTLLYRRAS